MEIWDIYDKNKNITGRFVSRDQGSTLKEGEFDLAVHVAIFNDNNEMLIQKRQSSKDTYPNYWDISAGGHSVAGETSEEAIERELFEELGYRYDFSNERPYLTIHRTDKFDDIYIIKDENIDINKLRLQYEEVQNVTWANKEEIHQLIEEGKFIPYCTGFIDLLFFQKDSRGVIEKSNGK